MILLTVGTQRFQFNRLLTKVDELIQEGIIKSDMFAQIGYSTYIPKNYKYITLISSDEMDHYFDQSDLIITHSGTSSIIKGLKKGKKIIVVPRQKKFDEHIDDHQLEIAMMFEKKGFIEVVYNINDLAQKIEIIKTKEYAKYANESKFLLNDIKKYIEKII